jgi:hypothetical protein
VRTTDETPDPAEGTVAPVLGRRDHPAPVAGQRPAAAPLDLVILAADFLDPLGEAT